ncbi:hypothetical protein D6825_01170 [Candidatus Woesearchaeota archaeon]|nr:MAG: hypothetical protein D6825_01170 [Candidatus Woesearchaeota archaeon]
MFVRVKNIKGRPYAYLVENEWTPWGSRQRVVSYLGRARLLEREHNTIEKLPDGFERAIKTAIEQELKNHGFKKHDDKYIKGQIVVDLNRKRVRFSKKQTVLGMNEGFLCEHTLKELLEYTPKEKQAVAAKKLAMLALESGLNLTQEQFVHIFEQAKKKTIKSENIDEGIQDTEKTNSEADL